MKGKKGEKGEKKGGKEKKGGEWRKKGENGGKHEKKVKKSPSDPTKLGKKIDFGGEKR